MKLTGKQKKQHRPNLLEIETPHVPIHTSWYQVEEKNV